VTICKTGASIEKSGGGHGESVNGHMGTDGDGDSDDWMTCDVDITGLNRPTASTGANHGDSAVPAKGAEQVESSRGAHSTTQKLNTDPNSARNSTARPAPAHCDAPCATGISTATSADRPTGFIGYTSKETKAVRCSLIVTGFPVELLVHDKEIMLEPFCKTGGRFKWVLGNRVLVSYSSEASAQRGFKASVNAMLRVEALEKYLQGVEDSALVGEWTKVLVY
jgi:hypothetical protein